VEADGGGRGEEDDARRGEDDVVFSFFFYRVVANVRIIRASGGPGRAPIGRAPPGRHVFFI
jgi:hypothetical protein